jgi:DNA-binding NarL/FixJ family response regulator
MAIPPANMTQPTSLYLVEDQAMIRRAVRSMLEDRDEFRVLGESGEAMSAVTEIEKLRPDVVLLDISMPGLSGLDAIRMIRKAAPQTKIVMLTHHEGETFVEQSLRLGAEGYLSKSSDPDELALAIQAVVRGDAYVSPRVSGGLVTRLRGGESGEPEPRSRVDSLTPRERQVFQLLALGKCNKEVASELGMSLGTAKKHRENLQRKLRCSSTAELARTAIREGLLDA